MRIASMSSGSPSSIAEAMVPTVSAPARMTERIRSAASWTSVVVAWIDALVSTAERVASWIAAIFAAMGTQDFEEHALPESTEVRAGQAPSRGSAARPIGSPSA